jgi:hypothetical protein
MVCFRIHSGHAPPRPRVVACLFLSVRICHALINPRGCAGHGKDYRRAAGGFIHGFRYTARALFRILSAKYEGKPRLGVETYDVTSKQGLADLEDKLFYRIDNSDANYQMVHSLGDGVVLHCTDDAGMRADYHEEVQIGNFQ